MATKLSTDAKSLKETAGKNIVSSSSSTVSLQKATKDKLADAGSSTVVLDSQKVRDVVVASSTGTSAAEEKAVEAAVQAAVVSGGAVLRTDITPVSNNTESVVTDKLPSSVVPASQSKLQKTASILDDAIRESEEKERQAKLEEQKELESENLVYQLRASASQGEQREDGTVNQEEVDLDAMREAAATTVAEEVLREAETPEEETPEEEEEAPKSKFQKLIEWVKSDTKHMIIAVAVVAGCVVLIVKLIKK